LVTTQLPNNRPGFSFLLSLMGQFNPGIQLGYGFVLSGIGGIVGINRRMNTEALLEAQQTHSLDDILFPEDPIGNATNIINTISSVFPPEDGYYVFGPMVKLFWGGVKDLVDFDVGIFIEFGGGIIVALMGTAHAALPTDEKAVIELNLDLLGVLDFGNKSLEIRASLFNSNILKKFTLSGDMALKSNWGDNPDFALSIGGFHPRFTPPPNFPDLKRLSVSLGKDNPRISLSCYLAVTTNTFQTGALLDLYAKAGIFAVTAALGFDALIRFNPFMFDIGIFGRAAIKVKDKSLLGVDLELNLTGPNPFHAKGHAIFEIFFKEVKVSFDKTFGDKVSEIPEIVSPLEVLSDALDKARPIYELPNWADEGVSLTEEAEAYLSPIGNIIITQNAVPLDMEMTKFGTGVPPETEKYLTLDVQDSGCEELEAPKTSFAPAQFKRMGDNEKLSAPAFEKFNSGIKIGGQGKSPNVFDERLMEYETILVQDGVPLQDAGFSRISGPRFSLANLPIEYARKLNQSWTMQGSKKYLKPAKKVINKESSNYITLEEPKFTVAVSESDNGQFIRASDGTATCSDMTYTEAKSLCSSMDNPNLQIMNIAYTESSQVNRIGE